jgi:hypothetical protein
VHEDDSKEMVKMKLQTCQDRRLKGLGVAETLILNHPDSKYEERKKTRRIVQNLKLCITTAGYVDVIAAVS